MVMRVKLALPQSEYEALVKLAAIELRNPHDQIRHILRQDLERRGLIPPELSAENGLALGAAIREDGDHVEPS